MKTKIAEKHKPREDYYISRVEVLEDGSIALLSDKYGSSSIIDIFKNGQKIRSIKLEDIPQLDSGNYNQCILKYKSGFGFLHETKHFVYWENCNSEPIVIKIANPIRGDEHNRKHHPTSGYYDKKSEKLWFALEEPGKSGFPAKYFCELDISETKVRKLEGHWGTLKQLPLSDFPKTANWEYAESEWLSINAFRYAKNRLLSYSVGGTVSRLKSGPNYEFSILGYSEPNSMSTETTAIEEGYGRFAKNSDYFILHPRLKKNKLLFYDIEGKEIQFEVSLTPKQNLGNEKKNYIYAEFDGNKLYLSSEKFLHVCEVIER